MKYEGPAKDAYKTAHAIIDLIERKGLEKQVFITAFNPYILEVFKKRKPSLFRGQLYGTFKKAKIAFYKKIILRNLILNSKADPDILGVEYDLVDADYVKKYHALGYRIFVWTVNKPEDMKRYIKYGVDGIITDYPKRLNEIYSQQNP